MRKISVIIGLTSSDMVCQALVNFLEHVPDITLEHANNQFILNQVLRDKSADILILEDSDQRQQHNYNHYFELRPNLGIITIDPNDTETLIRLSNTSCNQLLSLIRVLSDEQSANSKFNDGNSRLRHFQIEAEPNVEADNSLKIIDQNHPKERCQYFNEIQTWLDLTLHLYFSSLNLDNSEANIPGWAMSAVHARSLLGETYILKSQNELIELIKDSEARLTAFENNYEAIKSMPSFVSLIKTFDLSDIDKKIIMLLLAPELDDRYARIFGYINDDLNQKRPSASTIRQLLYGDQVIALHINQILSREGPLSRYRIITGIQNDTSPESMKGLKLTADVVEFLTASDKHNLNYGKHLCVTKHIGKASTGLKSVDSNLELMLKEWHVMHVSVSEVPIIQLLGNETGLLWFKREIESIGESVIYFNPIVDVNFYCPLEDQFDSAIRIAALHDAILVLCNFDQLTTADTKLQITALVKRVINNVKRVVIHSTDARLFSGVKEIWQLERILPDFNMRTQLWMERARTVGINLTQADASRLASTIRFDEPEIDTTLSLCTGNASANNLLTKIQDAARQVVRPGIPSLVRPLDAVFNWSDIVLADATLDSLRQIAGHIRHAGEVFENWDYQSRFPFGSGAAVLFSGPSGTGKTMAAQIIAKELGVELFQVDLANTVSKYIGETEKNLDVIFNAAEHASAVLLFDEADALFGKRTEVKDAHDRYANVEVAYLLQRMEAYSGLAILTTNFKQNLDSAFLRRLRFVIDFAAPPAKHREIIWQRAFPKKASVAKDIDFKFLASKLQLTGGNIQQIAIRAAFAAVAENDSIRMKHIVKATREELIKLGKLSSERSLNDWAPKLLAKVSS